MTYMLQDLTTGKVLSEHPNRDGARLSSLFHVHKGDVIYWRNAEDGPAQVATDYGKVGDLDRFRVYLY